MGTDRIDGTRLEGVPATALWTLRNRAVEAGRPDSTFSDPLAVRLHAQIDYPYDDFGAPNQSHPLRARTFDEAIRAFRVRHPDAVVVALGEGLQTSFWRLGDPTVRWLSVDLPELIALRERLLPAEDRIDTVATSALDRSWFDRIDQGVPVIISAEGLLMYFERDDALGLIADCAARFPGGRLIFDSIPKWFSDKTRAGLRLAKGSSYTTPPMPFHLSVTEAARLPESIPNVAASTDLELASGRGLWGSRVARALANRPPLRDRRPSITAVDFAA